MIEVFGILSYRSTFPLSNEKIKTKTIAKQFDWGLKCGVEADRFKAFQVSLKTVVRFYMNILTGFACCNHWSCSYWPFKDLFQMCFQCKISDGGQNPQSFFCAKMYYKD